MNEQLNMIPEQYRPLSPWAYFGLGLLFSVPVVGFVFLIVFSISRANINRRNFARSYFCGLIIALGVCAVVLVLMLTGVVSSALKNSASSITPYFITSAQPHLYSSSGRVFSAAVSQITIDGW